MSLLPEGFTLAVISETLSRWLRSEWGPLVIKGLLLSSIAAFTVSLRTETFPKEKSKAPAWIFGGVMVLIGALCLLMEYGYL